MLPPSFVEDVDALRKASPDIARASVKPKSVLVMGGGLGGEIIY